MAWDSTTTPRPAPGQTTVPFGSTVPVGTPGGASVTHVAGESFTGDGSTTAFVLANTPIAGSVAVYVNGVRVSTWSLSTATVTFSAAPASGDEILIDYVY